MIAISILLIGLGNLSMVDGWYGSGGDIHEGSYWSDGKVKKGLLWERIEVGWQMTYEYSPKETDMQRVTKKYNSYLVPDWTMDIQEWRDRGLIDVDTFDNIKKYLVQHDIAKYVGAH